MTRPRAAVHRTIMVVDVAGFGDHRRTNVDQIAVRAGLYRALQHAFREANISWADCDHEDRGDGVLILAPAEMIKGPFIECLPRPLTDALRAHNQARPAEEQIRLRMALHAGEINYDDHGVTAAAINLAFRLLDAVPLKADLASSSGELAIITSAWFFDEVVRHSTICDPATYRQVSVTVKETTATAWIHLPNVVSSGDQANSDASRLPSTTAPPATHEPLHGRDQELARLRDAAMRARTGRFTLALVTGESGIGKSALTEAISSQLAGQGWTIGRGNCPERDSRLAGRPWTELLHDLVDRFPLRREQTVELAPLLYDRAPRPAPGDLPAARFRLRTAISGYLAGIACAAPLLVVLNDLHDADREALILLTDLAADLTSQPILVVATYRADEVDEQLTDTLATLARHEPVHINLTGLAAPAINALMRGLCTRPITAATVAMVERRTEGNPFFVREIARLLETDGEHAAVADVPPGVRHIVRRRIARLPASTQAALRQASVVGRDFTLDVLSAITDLNGDALVECLESAVTAGLLVEPHVPIRSLRFAHTLVRETLYHDMSQLRRTAIHARVGAALEHLRPNDVVPLAHHFNAAQAPDAAAKAARYSRIAAEQAGRRYAHRKAAMLWQQALHSYAQSPTGTLRERLKLTIETIRALSTAGEHQAARTLRDDALAEVIGLGDATFTARVIVAYDAHGLWPHHPYGQTPDKLVNLIDRTLHELPARHQQLRCRMLACLAIELEHCDDSHADAASLEAVTLARQLNDPGLLATALNARFRRSYWTSTLTEREQIAAELLALGKKHNLIAVEAIGRQALIRCACGRGNFAAAREHATESERLATTYDLPTARITASWYHGLDHMINGRYAEAAQAYQRAAELTRQAGLAGIEQGLFAVASLSLAIWTETLADIVDLLHVAYTIWPTPGTDAYALALVAAGRYDEARAVATRRPPIPRDILFKIIMTVRGLVGLALNDHDRITEAYHSLRPFEDEIAGGDTGGFVVLLPVAQLLGDLALRLEQPQTANAHYLKARQIAERSNVAQWITMTRRALAGTIIQSKPYRAW